MSNNANGNKRVIFFLYITLKTDRLNRRVVNHFPCCFLLFSSFWNMESEGNNKETTLYLSGCIIQLDSDIKICHANMVTILIYIYISVINSHQWLFMATMRIYGYHGYLWLPWLSMVTMRIYGYHGYLWLSVVMDDYLWLSVFIAQKGQVCMKRERQVTIHTSLCT